MAGSTHGLCMSLCAVQMFLFRSVTSSCLQWRSTTCYPLQSVQCGHDHPNCGEGELGFADKCLVNYLILMLWRGQNAHHLSV